jgi:hypothetical protein
MKPLFWIEVKGNCTKLSDFVLGTEVPCPPGKITLWFSPLNDRSSLMGHVKEHQSYSSKIHLEFDWPCSVLGQQLFCWTRKLFSSIIEVKGNCTKLSDFVLGTEVLCPPGKTSDNGYTPGCECMYQVYWCKYYKLRNRRQFSSKRISLSCYIHGTVVRYKICVHNRFWLIFSSYNCSISKLIGENHNVISQGLSTMMLDYSSFDKIVYY